MKPPLHLREINRAREYYNPLRGLDIARVVRLLEDGERGRFDELQKLNRMAEKRHPTLKGLKSRRLSSLGKLDWDCKVPDTLPAGLTAAQAEAQRVYLRSTYDQIGNLTEAIEFLGLSTFRGFSHLEKRYQDDNSSLACVALNPVPQWHWLRDPDTWEWRYDAAARYQISSSVTIEAGDFIIREVDDPLCEIALLCFIRRGLAKKDWTAFMEDYAIPSVFAMLGENTPLDKVKEWLEIMKLVTSNSRGALPPGSKVETLEAGQLDGVQFQNFISAEDSDLVLAGTGGLLTMLTANTGLGGDKQGDNHEKTFDAIAQAEAKAITGIFQKQFDYPLLEQEFPGQPAVAYFELAAQDEEDVSALADRAQKFFTAGLEVDAAEVSEKSGLKLTRKAAPEPTSGAPAAEPAAEPLTNRAKAESAGQDAIFKANADAQRLAARRAVFRPIAERLAAIDAIQDPDQRRAAVEQFRADAGRLNAEVIAKAPELAKPLEELIGSALVSGFVEAAEARNPAAPRGANKGPGRKTAPSAAGAPPNAR